MSLVNVTSVDVRRNPAPLNEPFEFEVVFECLEALDVDLEWKLIYVGSADNKALDQELDCVVMGPIHRGALKFTFEADPPDFTKIPHEDIHGFTIILLTGSYREEEFIRIGWYVHNVYSDPCLQDEPPDSPDLAKMQRVILTEAPRVTRFKISWDMPKFEECTDTTGMDTTGMDTTGMGTTGMGTTGMGTTGMGTTGMGTTGMGTAGMGTAGMGTTGMGTAGMGTAGMGTAGMGTAGMGTTGMGTAGMGTAGMGTAGMGTAGMGTAGVGFSTLTGNFNPTSQQMMSGGCMAMSQNIPSGMSQNIPSGMSQNIPSGMSQNIPSGMSQNISSGMGGMSQHFVQSYGWQSGPLFSAQAVANVQTVGDVEMS